MDSSYLYTELEFYLYIQSFIFLCSLVFFIHIDIFIRYPPTVLQSKEIWKNLSHFFFSLRWVRDRQGISLGFKQNKDYDQDQPDDQFLVHYGSEQIAVYNHYTTIMNAWKYLKKHRHVQMKTE